MLVPFRWLKEYVSIKKSPTEVAEILTMAGLEVEGLEQSGDDHILDISLTPNRGDCLSILGVAREIGAVTGKKIKYPKFQIPDADPRPYIKVRIDDKTLCRRYAGRVIKGVKVSPSPDWLKTKLESSGIRSINNIVDITNYVMLEYGQPLHAFNYEKLGTRMIRVARPGKTVKFRSLDGVERQIRKDTLLIWDGDVPVAIAGIMGGLESVVDETTTSIFLESACFDPISVRKSSSMIGLRTESSFRFERGIDLMSLDKALDRASSLISEVAGGYLCKMVDVYPKKYTPRYIKLNYGHANHLLGTSLSNLKTQDLLTRMGAQVEDTFNYLQVEVPSYRNDIERDVDLIEEIARLHGFQKIIPVPPAMKIGARPVNTARRKTRMIRHLLCQRDYSEVVNFSFMNDDILRVLKISKDDFRCNAVKIMNPLRQEESLMRTFLLPSLIANLQHNVNRGMRDVRLFEISRVFLRHKTSEKLPVENLRLAGISLREDLHHLWKTSEDVFYRVKGAVDALLNSLHVLNFRWEMSLEPFLHPGKSADLFIGGKKAGFVGMLSPDILPLLDINIQKTGVGVFELDLDLLLSASSVSAVFEKFSVYPYVQRDLSILVDSTQSSQDILDVLRSFKSDLIDDIGVFDYFRGKNIPEGKVSFAFSITYRSFDRTLSEDEVDSVHCQIVEHLVKKTGAELRA